MAIYGIDLGTTFCSVAYVDVGGHPRVVALERGLPTLASLVLLTNEPDGRPHAAVGREAKQQYRQITAGNDAPPPGVFLVRGSKNFIGVRDNVMGGPPWRIAQHDLFSTDIAAVILRTLAEIVRARPGLPPMEQVVVTHPQRFRNTEKLATAQAVKLASLGLAGMITEPDAAAWAYGLHERGASTGTFLVFDFGGGTLDVTVMARRAGAQGNREIHAIGSYGIQLGGLQIDERIRDGIVEKYRQESGDRGFSLESANEATREQLLELAESFKVDLNRDASNDPSPMLRARSKTFRVTHEDGTEGHEVRLKISLGELSAWISGEIDRAMACADEALQRSGVKWDDVGEVLLTGGSSQLLALQHRMRERCGDRVQVIFDDQDHPLRPSTIVAVGAALYGASLVSPAGTPAPIEVRGVVPDSFSVRAFQPDSEVERGRRPILHTLIQAGTPTPFVGHAHFVMRGGGRVVPVEMFEGRTEDEATPIGVFQLEFDENLVDGTRVEVQLRVGSNGAIVLAVHDSRSGNTREAPLNEAPGLFSDAELDERRSWLQDMKLEFNPD